MASYDSSEMHGLPLLPNVTHPHGTVAFSTQTTPPAYGWTDSLVLTTPWHGHVAQPVTMPQYSYEAVFNAPVSWSQAPSAVRTVPSQQYDMQPQPGYQPQEVSSAPAGPSAYGRQTLFPQGQGDVLTNPFPRSRSSRAQMTTPARESSIGLTTARGKRIASSPILRSSGPRVFREQGPARSEPAEQQGEGEQNDDEDDEDEEEGDEEGEDGSPSDQLGPESEAEDGSDDGEDASENESEDESTNESANESEAVLSGDGGARGAELGHTPDQQEAFAQLARVRRRANVTTEENAEYMCFCGKQFRRQYNFRTHLQTHDPSRLYAHPCPYENCDKKFTRKSDLLRHENSVRAHLTHCKDSLANASTAGPYTTQEIQLSSLSSDVRATRHPSKVCQILGSMVSPVQRR